MKTLLATILMIIVTSFGIAQGSLDSGLVAYFPFNGNAIDVTGTGHNGTVNGGILTDDRFNQPEKAYTFPNLHNNIVLDNSTGLNLENGFTLNTWVKYKNINCGIVGKHNCWVVNGFYLGIDNGHYYFRLGNSVWSEIVTSETYVEEQWYMVTGVYDHATSTGKVYVNGVLKASGSVLYNNYSSAPITISEGSNGCPDGNMPGAIDEVKIYNRALSDAEILAEYNSSNTDLVAYYPFNGNADDETGNGYDGTVSGATLTTDRFNETDKAYNFVYNGFSSDKILVSGTSGLNFSSGGFSLSAWIRFSGTAGSGNNYPIVSKHICGEQSGYILMLFNGKLTFWLAGSSGYNVLSTAEDYTDDSWHQVAAVYDGSNQYIYVDGLLKNSVAFSYSVFNSADWALGGYNGCNGGFNGKVDEVKIYNRPLSAVEILDDYNLTRSSLLAYFPFNGNANDETGNGYDGTINGNAALVPDRFNSTDKAFTFPDQSSNISLANSVNLNLESGFTLNAWVKYKNTYSVVIGKHLCGIVNGFILGIDYDGQFQLWLGNAGWQTVRTGATLVEDQWYMLTATYDGGSGTAKIYLNGQLENSATISYTNFSSYPISIGEVYQNNCSAANMSGAVDEVKIYNRPLSDFEIMDEYSNSYNDLVLFLPFNSNANDESGSGNNGTVNGATLTQDRFGINNKAYQFDGINDYISIADNPNLFSDELTISWWYKLTETPGPASVVIGWVDGGHRYQQFFNGEMFGYFNGYNLSAPGLYFNPIYNLNYLNVWKHIVVTYQKTSATTSTTSIYVDGELKQTDNHTLAMDYASGIEFKIGKNVNGNFFKGYLDDFRILNRILTSNEILDLYNDSTTYLPPLEDGLVAYWPLNGNTNDSTFNNNDGINHSCVYTYDRFSNESSSLYFDGNYYYVEGINPGNNLPIGNSSRTFSAWVKNYENNISGSNIFHYGTQQSAPTNFHFLITDVLGLGNGYGYGVVYGNTNLIDTAWHFVTGVYEGGTERITKLYVDGKLDATGTITTEPNTTLSTNWRMGRFMEGGIPFKGNLDEIKVYEIPLTSQQIWEVYKATTTAPNLLFPGNDSTLINPDTTLVLDWDSTITATSYRLLISNDSLFNTVAYDTIVTVSSFVFDNWSAINFDNINWKVRTINDGGIGPWSETNRFSIILTDVEEETQLPTEFALMQNYPNPFNPNTTITYHLPKASNVELKVYDVLGNEIATLVNEEKPIGIYNVQFTMNNLPAGRQGLSSGIYFYKLTAGDYVSTKKMILIK